MEIFGVGATPESQQNAMITANKQGQEPYSIFDYEDVNNNGYIDEKDFNNDNVIISWFKNLGIFGQKWADVEKAEIQRQYPYYTQEDVDARYEIEHMKYRSAEIIDAIHGGDMPSVALANYRQTIQNIENGIIEEYTPLDVERDLDGYKRIATYDSHNRIISSATIHDRPENGTRTVIYSYNDDGSYREVYIEPSGETETLYFDKHGRRSDIKLEGDYR